MNAKMTKAIVMSILTAVAVFFFSSTASAQSESLLLVGPASMAKDQTLDMMDQVVILESSAAEDVAKAIESDSYIAVFGYISETGQLASTRIEVLDIQYVPGSSLVMMSGLLLASVDKNGHVSLGDLTIDLTPSLSTVNRIDSDELAVFTGVQPNPDGIMVAQSAIGFALYSNFSGYQNSYSDLFLASINGIGVPISIDGSGGVSIDGSGGVSIDGSGGVSIGDGDEIGGIVSDDYM